MKGAFVVVSPSAQKLDDTGELRSTTVDPA
jgi:hypothetical protein